jgi:hypothetical protein
LVLFVHMWRDKFHIQTTSYVFCLAHRTRCSLGWIEIKHGVVWSVNSIAVDQGASRASLWSLRLATVCRKPRALCITFFINHCASHALACSWREFVQLKVAKVWWQHVSAWSRCIFFVFAHGHKFLRLRWSNHLGRSVILEVREQVLTLWIVARVVYTRSWSKAGTLVSKSLLVWRPCCSAGVWYCRHWVDAKFVDLDASTVVSRAWHVLP